MFLDTVVYLRTIDALPVLKKLQITLLVTMLAGTKVVETNLVSLKCKETCL